MLVNKRILLVISGGIAAYKALDLIRLLRRAGAHVTPLITEGGQQFITPMSVAAVAECEVYTDLFSLKNEAEMGHIRLTRESDMALVAPASADIMARLANGLADDLATTTLLAADTPVCLAPAMNARMWDNPATQANLATLQNYGYHILGPGYGDMACGEEGWGRMLAPEQILAGIEAQTGDKPLAGKSALVTSGPTHEPIDSVRYLGNHSTGMQGHAIARALSDCGADVTLISGPVDLPDPPGVTPKHVTSAQEMHDAVINALPVDIAVCAAAVSDWRPSAPSQGKQKKDGSAPPELTLTETPDILAELARNAKRPALLIGFAAEYTDIQANAAAKLERKGCDWLLANFVDGPRKGFGTDDNDIYCLKSNTEQIDHWPRLAKPEIAQKLCDAIVRHFNEDHISSDKGGDKDEIRSVSAAE
jgi:phosphopantothenoylcysteine decarboxylase/phosphopantothenate--cysteine ligase